MAVVKMFPVGRSFRSYVNKVFRHYNRNEEMPAVCAIAVDVDPADGTRLLALVEVTARVIRVERGSPPVPQNEKQEVLEITVPLPRNFFSE